MTIKLCLWCKRCDFDMGSQHYSEMTPGSNASIVCYKDRFDYVLNNLTHERFLELIAYAKDCEHFELNPDLEIKE